MSHNIKKYLRSVKIENLRGYMDLMEHFYIIQTVIKNDKIPVISGRSKQKTQIKIIDKILNYLNKESEIIWQEIDPGGSDKLKMIKKTVDAELREVETDNKTEIIAQLPISNN